MLRLKGLDEQTPLLERNRKEAMLQIFNLLLLCLLAVSGRESICQTYGTKELSQFSKEGDINIGGIFSFHQNPVTVNPSFQVDPGNMQCNG